MPRLASNGYQRHEISLAAVTGSFLGTDQRILCDQMKPGYRFEITKLLYVVGPVAGIGAGATQTWMLRKGAAAAILDTTTAADPAAGATNIKLTSVTGILVNHWLTLELPGGVESRQITAVGTAGGGGTGITVSPGFTNDHGNAENARVHANPILALIALPLANSTVGAVIEQLVPQALLAGGWAKFLDADGFSLVRAAGGTVYTTEPSGSFIVRARQLPQMAR